MVCKLGKSCPSSSTTRARLSPLSGWITAPRSARTRLWAWNSRGLPAWRRSRSRGAGPPHGDGIPVRTADLSETGSIRDTLHNVDRVLVGNHATLKNALVNFAAYTASLASKGDAIDSIIRKADNAFESFDSAMTKIDNVVPGLADGKADELFHKVKSIRELAESFNKRSGALIEEGRPSLLDVSQAAIKVTRKFEPQAGSGGRATSPRIPSQKRQ